MNDHDPRIDPQPQDVTQNMSGDTYKVTERGQYYVKYIINGDELLEIDIDGWRECAKNDKIIHVAE